MHKDLDTYFSGKKIYGDDFGLEKIREWFEDEEEAYSELIDEDYTYEFHGLNKYHFYSKLGHKSFKKALLFGGAQGYEVLPIIEKIDEINIVEPSENLKNDRLGNKPLKYFKPSIGGKLAFEEDSFDLVTCFGVLHHIPNVSLVISELARVLQPGGLLLVREPIITMGDWRGERKGLTKRERGIPVNLLRKKLTGEGLKIVYEKKVVFPITRRISLNNRFLVMMDSLLSTMFSWNYNYHPKNIFQKLQPGAAIYILEKK